MPRNPPPEHSRWKPGQSGNPNGRPKRKPVSDEIAALLSDADGQAAKALAKVILREALKGDIAFVREVLDRAEGKAQALLDVTTKDESLNGDKDAAVAKAEALIATMSKRANGRK
jgi:hypothetical protein